jgi:hypothetical protein
MKRAFWSLVLLTGCAVLHGSEPKPDSNDPPWGEERDRFTRRVKVYDVTDDKAFAVALYEPMRLRKARVDRLAEWRVLTPEEKQKLLVKEEAEAAAEEDFLLAFYTGNRADNDLDSPRSVWRVALVVGEQNVLPARIEVVRHDATLRTLHPFIGDFDTVYRIRFPVWRGPKPLVDTQFILRIAGAPGRVDLKWKPEEKNPP